MRTALKAAVAAVVLFSIGCVSQSEHDATVAQLQTVTSERDALKTELEKTKAELATAQQTLTDAQAKAAAPTPDAGAAAVAPSPAPTPAPAKAKKMGKPQEGGAPPAK